MQAGLPEVKVFTDYSQWERRPSTKSGTSGGWSIGGRGRGKTQTTKSKTSRQDALLLAARLSQGCVMVDPGPQHVPQLHVHCHGSSRKSPSMVQPRHINTTTFSPRRKIEKAKAPTVTSSINQMKLEAKRKSIQDFRKYREDLLAANLELIGSIQKNEDEKNSVVQEILEKYRKSRGSVAALKKKTHRDMKELQAELDRTKHWVLQKEKELHEEVREAELLLQAKIKERDILKSFKEKKFMVNQATIDQLRDDIRAHAHLNQDRIATLEAEMSEERDKCQRMMDHTRREIEAEATERCIGLMKRSVKEKGIQNRIMEKEIDLHHHKAETLRQSIEDLREKISQLKVEIEVDKARTRPLVLLEKCLPDTELHLSFPVHEDF